MSALQSLYLEQTIITWSIYNLINRFLFYRGEAGWLGKTMDKDVKDI